VFWLAYCDEHKEDKGLRRDMAGGGNGKKNRRRASHLSEKAWAVI
jgi:hypothetical protein